MQAHNARRAIASHGRPPVQIVTRSQQQGRKRLLPSFGGRVLTCTWGRPKPWNTCAHTSHSAVAERGGQAPPADVSDSVAAPSIKESPHPAPTAGGLDWFGRWWPVHDVASLLPKEPLHVDLLGLSLVVWANAAGDWHALDDKCPHRLAPLSEGRVEPQGLHCAYHGWTFDGRGTCTSIPQLSELPAERQAAACASPRARVASYPTHTAHGLLWVWPQAGAWEAALAAIPSLGMGAGLLTKSVSPWFVRDVPIRYDTLLENVVDPSHVPYAHHGVQGNRYKPRHTWYNMQRSDIGEGGFVASAPLGKLGDMSIQFSAPFMARYILGTDLVGPQVLIVPTKPGWSRLLANFPTTMSFLPAPVRLLMALKHRGTAWDHITQRNAVIDGDTYLLHVAERQLPVSKGIGAETVTQTYYLPGAADGAVIDVRRWLQNFAGPVPTCRPEDEPDMPPLMSKEQVLDRWSQHTRHCVHCRNAVARIDALRVAVATAGLLAGVAAVAQVVAANIVRAQVGVRQGLEAVGLLGPALAWSVLLLAAAALWHWLGGVRQQFFYVPYVHAHRD